jgi:hypothetical protein
VSADAGVGANTAKSRRAKAEGNHNRNRLERSIVQTLSSLIDLARLRATHRLLRPEEHSSMAIGAIEEKHSKADYKDQVATSH